MAVLGQFWYVTEGDNGLGFSDARVAYINDDGSNPTTVVDNTPTFDLGSQFVEDVVLDTAAGLYYVLTGGDGVDAKLLVGHIGSAAAPTVAFTFDPAGGGNNLTFGLHLDPVSHKIYVGFIDFVNFDDDHQGIRQFTYDVSTGAVTDDGLIVTQTTAQIQPSAPDAFPLFIPRDFDIDYTHGVIYASQYTLGDGFETNTLVRFSLADPDGSAAVSLIDQSFFALDGDGADFPTLPNGIILDVEVDQASDRVFFATHQENVGGANHEDDAIWVITNASTASNVTPTKVTLSGAGFNSALFYPGDIVLDEVNNILYVESEQTDTAGPSDDVILVFQLTSDTTATLIQTISPSFNGVANIQGMTFDELAVLANVNGTTTHAVEQGANLALLTGAPTITDLDGDHLASATVTISGGFLGSGDDLFISDGGHKTSGTFTGTNITIALTTDGSGNQKLTLSGYDTLANYQSALNAVTFNANGDNPTNYGSNASRTISWQVNDGAAGDPSGTPDGTTTNLRTTTLTIDAVNDAPVNHLPVSNPSGNEDATFAINGVSISDVDANPTSDTMTVTLSVAHGTLAVRTDVAGGLGAGDVSGNGTASVTLTGTQAAINATLADATGLQYSGNANFNGADTLTLTTSDNGHTGNDPGLTGGPANEQDQDLLTINVANVNDTPTANATSASGAEDAAPRIAITLSGADVDGDALNFVLTSLAGHGQLFLTASGGTALAVNDTIAGSGNSATIYFQQTADYNGPDSFTYKAFDGAENSAAATASISLTAVADIVNDSVTVNQNSGANTLALLANDTFENAARAITAVSVASHGTAVINDNSTPGDATDDFVVYTPNAGYSGSDSFTYTVTSGGVTETATVSVNVASIGQVINGGNGNDTLNGTAGDDTISGNNGNDVINAGDGNDTVNGGSGNDRLIGGNGNDTLTGGSGNDTFVFGPSFGTDTVTDFGGNDHIEFDGGVFANFAAVQAAMTQVGADTVITLAAGHTITLQNVTASNLHANDFLFM